MKKLILLLLMFVAVQGMGQIKGGIKLETGLTIYPTFIEVNDTTCIIPPCGIDVDTMRFIPERIGISPEEYYSSNLGTLIDYNSYDIPYLTLRKRYKAYCNREVMDTLIQNGEIITVHTITDDGGYSWRKDTIWFETKKEYKNSEVEYYLNIAEIDPLNIDLPIYPSVNKRLTRKVPIKIKQEKPTPGGFWIWVEENYLK